MYTALYGNGCMYINPFPGCDIFMSPVLAWTRAHVYKCNSDLLYCTRSCFTGLSLNRSQFHTAKSKLKVNVFKYVFLAFYSMTLQVGPSLIQPLGSSKIWIQRKPNNTTLFFFLIQQVKMILSSGYLQNDLTKWNLKHRQFIHNKSKLWKVHKF